MFIQNYSPLEPSSNFTTEGCFCPDGTKLFNEESGICVEKCGKWAVSLMDILCQLHGPTGLLIFQQDVLTLMAFLARWATSLVHAHSNSMLPSCQSQLSHWPGLLFQFNEKFEYKCQNCICEESTKTVSCKPKVCPAPPPTACTDPGFVLVNQTNPADPCCSTFSCRKTQSVTAQLPSEIFKGAVYKVQFIRLQEKDPLTSCQ